ncbi:PKD-like family lipoprotein [Pedobacter faecalis]|uniref:PKD-like family lipoprotein n=1 Tax=Pedobacter faecalis TaxID=3041495 RepID=UPI00254FCF9A|nr:PKD-like family lipoprotein [Pedobacter sp. ELA7]
MNAIYKNLAVIGLGIVSLTSCYKDDSNLDIKPVNQIGLSDPKSATQMTIFQGDSLKLKPALTQSLAENISNVEFTWLLYNNNGAVSLAAPREEIATGHELKIVVKPETFTLGEPFIIRLRATDKQTGVSSYLNYSVLVGNKYATGWMVLEDKAGKGDLSFIFTDYTAEHGIYNDRNTSAITGPRKLEITTYPVTDDISATGKRMYILADQGSQEYNYLTMVKKFDYSFLFFSAPSVINPTVMTWTSQYTYSGVRSPSLGIAINNGKLHSNLVGGFPGVKKWGDIALNPQGNRNYSLAPFVVGGETFPAIVYDNTDKRFYRIQAYNPTPVAGTLEAFPSGASTGVSSVFDMNDVGMTMIFQDSADVAHDYNAIMKDANNQPFLLRYKTKNTTASPIITLGKTQMNAPGILNFSAAAGSTRTPHIYYGNGNVLSRYETSSNTVVETYSFPTGENITCVKYARDYVDRAGAKLAVATWNGTQGKVYYFAINTVGGIGSYTKVVTDFARIVDMAYKY